jgi:hypothetical protein
METVALMYKIKLRCTRCGNRWVRRTSNPASADPPCPRVTQWDADGNPTATCGQEVNPIGMDYTSNRAPSIGGENLYVRALDETNRIVTEDYGMSNIHTDGGNQHHGDVAAPKLRPDLQARADNMFAPPKTRRNPMPRLDAGMLGRFVDPKAPDVMRAIHEAKWRPPVHIVNER